MPFEEFYRQNFKTVYGFLINLCKSSDLAEELTAETFFKHLNITKATTKSTSPQHGFVPLPKTNI